MNTKRIRNLRNGNLLEKGRRKLRQTWVSALRNHRIYPYCYKAGWHCLVFPEKADLGEELYFAARPNPGAGIGHQMANWISGYWFAGTLGLKFAHIPFSSPQWEQLLGFYQGEKSLKELKEAGYKVVRLPLFYEDNPEQCAWIHRIIRSYGGQKVVFLAEQDQPYRDQFGVMADLQRKFYSAPARDQDRLLYQPDCFNIAIHVRRGDIMENPGGLNENLAMRFQSNDYFLQALRTALTYLGDKENIRIYLFSQGEEGDYPEFSRIPNLRFCLDMGARESFLHMVYADALITSKSSFSYKPALLNRGIKFCPADFWHGYPNSEDWILLDARGLPAAPREKPVGDHAETEGEH